MIESTKGAEFEKVEERLDLFHINILRHIKEHPAQTENQIATALLEQKICSKVTTLKKIDELREMGEIKDLLKEGESGFHKLYINDKESEFTRINNQLITIENLVGTLRHTLYNLDSDLLNQVNQGKKNLFKAHVQMAQIVGGCRGVIQTMLESLLLLTDRKVHSQSDSQILYKKIVKLMLIVVHGSYLQVNAREKLNIFGEEIKKEAHSKEIIAYAKRKGIDLNLKTFITTVDNFQKNFLSE